MKAIIFDLDGTLVYTERETRLFLISKALSYFQKDYPDDEIDTLWFMHDRNTLLDKWGVHRNKFWDIFNNKKMIKERIKHTHAFDDVDYLVKLKKKGLKLAIHTGAPPYTANKEIAMLPEVFDAVLIADPTGNTKSKPAPDGVFAALKSLDVDIKDAIYVGNSDEDLLTAKNAGIFSVLIDRKEHPHAIKPDAKIESLYELERFI